MANDQKVIKVDRSEVVGHHIPTIISQLIQWAKNKGAIAEFELNSGIIVRVSGASDANLIHQDYTNALQSANPTENVVGP